MKKICFVLLPITFWMCSVYGDEHQKTEKKNLNFLVYIAANNNLSKYTKNSLQEMKLVGDNDRYNLIVQVDQAGKNEISRLKIEKNKVIYLEQHEPTQLYRSGTPESLFEFVRWAQERFPSRELCLVIWNHGSGIVDGASWSRPLAIPEGETLRHSSTRTLRSMKGIAFNEKFSTYITNQQLTETLSRIKHQILDGHNINILGLDACHMAMIEVCSQVQDSVNILVGSQEIEPGKGWSYTRILKCLQKEEWPTYEYFATHIVKCYARTHEQSFVDFTQSAIDLRNFAEVEKTFDELCRILIEGMEEPWGNELVKMLYKIRISRSLTTSFHNRDYIDLQHFIFSIAQQTKEFLPTSIPQAVKDKIRFACRNMLLMLRKHVIASAKGSHQQSAEGLSIYFPRHNKIEKSYTQTIFSRKTSWTKFLSFFIAKTVH